ncbi:MAG: helix-turn-helix transcriptional regulator, partial [Rhodocyclaceae bacterium]|nr:helix-turn-helix transcriptional regulator [Rhodocyclaceae bacterium]
GAMSITVMRIDMAKKPAAKDWHNADIVASLHKAGHSLSGLARSHGYTSSSALAQALQHPYPKAERLIAEAINNDGVTPATIWPSRYHADGTPKSGRGERGLGRYRAKCSASSNAGKVNSRKAR